MTEPSRRPFMSSIVGKIIPSLTAGALVFGITSVTKQDVIQGVLLSVLVGGIVLLIEFLSEFEQSIESLQNSQREGLANFSEATRLYDRVERSPVIRAQVNFLLNQVGDLGRDTHSLLLDLVDLEINRLGLFIKQVHDAGRFGGAVQSSVEQPFSIAYHGEDREWLLALTCVAKSGIDAVSLSTIDAGVNNYDGGLWRSDLGHRYLELQRQAIRRDLRIRRIFYFDRPAISQDGVFQDICARQKAIGVDVRILEESVLPPDLKILVSDFIVFDESLAYEMASAVALADGHRPERLTTYLSTREERVQDLHGRFEQFWALAHEPEWMRQHINRRLPADPAAVGEA
jgi:hypothetical protein